MACYGVRVFVAVVLFALLLVTTVRDLGLHRARKWTIAQETVRVEKPLLYVPIDFHGPAHDTDNVGLVRAIAANHTPYSGNRTVNMTKVKVLIGQTPETFKAGELGDVYATLLVESNIEYFRMAMVMVWDLLRTDPEHRVLVAYAANLNDLGMRMLATLWAISDNRVLLMQVDLLPPVQRNVYGSPRYKHQQTKLLLWNMTMFSRIVFYDADHIIRRSPAGAFECGAELCATCDPNQARYNGRANSRNCGGLNGGFLVITPDRDVCANLLRSFYHEQWPSHGFAEQDFLDYYYGSRWQELSQEYNVLNYDVSAKKYPNPIAEHLKSWTPEIRYEMTRWRKSVQNMTRTMRLYDGVPDEILSDRFWYSYFDSLTHPALFTNSRLSVRRIVAPLRRGHPSFRRFNPFQIQRHKKSLHRRQIRGL